MSTAIAIVGMACRFPDASHPSQFWQNILDRRTSFRAIPNNRWDHSLYYSEKRRTPNASYSKKAALLDGVDLFAATKFKISPRRAKHMDPQQRLLLEVAREALQDGGFESRAWNRDESAVFVGVNLSEYGNLMATRIRGEQLKAGQFGEPSRATDEAFSDITDANAYSLPGSNISMCASCLAQEFDCGGPALVVDAACASSMAATIQGVQYLRNLPSSEESSPLVLVGGTYLHLTPENSICFSKIGALAESECRPFDAQSEGFILGEGAAAILLKRLDDARRDGDKIYAVIDGVAWNNQGRSASPTTPSQDGQVRVMKAGLKDANYEPASVSYIECHGTGTAVGDPIEMASLAEVFGDTGARPRLGSIKANIGHGLGVSGLAGLMRAALSLHHRTLPPQAGWQEWHPDLIRYEDQFEISTEAKPNQGSNSRAVVSSFAFGGTNCFIALSGMAPQDQILETEPELLFRFSASNEGLLSAYLGSLLAHLENPENSLSELAGVLASRELENKLVLIKAKSRQELVANTHRAIDSLDHALDEWTLLSDNCLCGPRDVEMPKEYQEVWANSLVLSAQKMPNLTLPFIPLERKSFWFTKTPFSTVDKHPKRPRCASSESLGRTLQPLTQCDLNPEVHPYLLDHAIQGRPVLALACAIELMTRGLPFPIALKNIKVKRGVILSQSSRVELVQEGAFLRLFEIRPTGRRALAFEAEVNTEVGEAPGLQHSPISQSRYRLLDFYRGDTFHGPLFQGVQDIFGSSRERLSARVLGATTLGWDDKSWRVDPLALDSALQLAAFWSLSELGRGMLPESIEEMVLLGAFGSQSVFVDLNLAELTDETATGDFLFRVQGETLGWLRGVRGTLVEPEKIKRKQTEMAVSR